MQEEFYILQYHLYVLALHQYMKMRIPHYDYEEHFGGVYYIFFRGVDPATGSDTGIFRDRPARESIEFLGRSLLAHSTFPT